MRLIVVPAVLFAVVSTVVFGFAKWHPAKRERAAPPAGTTVIRDPVRGQRLFAENCEGCHGERGQGGRVGPTLAGSDLTLDEARERIVNGGGVMPAGLVMGQDLEDVLSYLQLVFNP